MKRFLLCAAVLTAVSMAAPARANSMSYTYKGDREANFLGPYVGADVAYGWGDLDVPKGDTTGIEGGAFAGYGFTQPFQYFGGYAGIEGGYNWSDEDGSSNGTDFEKKHDWHVTFRPGAVLNNNMLGYEVVGYSNADYKVGADEENLNGLMLGVGAEFSTHTPLNLRAEYIHTNYEDKTVGGSGINPDDNSVRLGAVWHFY